jgi:hypothetical protein
MDSLPPFEVLLWLRKHGVALKPKLTKRQKVRKVLTRKQRDRGRLSGPLWRRRLVSERETVVERPGVGGDAKRDPHFGEFCRSGACVPLLGSSSLSRSRFLYSN